MEGNVYFRFGQLLHLRALRGCRSKSFWITVFVLCALVCYATVVALKRSRRNPNLEIPRVPKPRSLDYRKILRESNAKYPNQPFLLPLQDPTVIIPPHCIESLKNAPDTRVSFNGSQYDRFAVRWTNSGVVEKELAHSVKYDLAREMGGLLPTIQQEVELSASSSIPANDQWTTVPLQQATVNIVGSVFGSVIVGAPLSRGQSWLSSSIGHAVDVVFFSMKLHVFPKLFQPLVAHLLPDKRRVAKSKEGIAKTVGPIIDKCLNTSESEKITADQDVTTPAFEQGRLVQWLMKRYNPATNADLKRSLILRDHYTLCFAAIHGPSTLLVNAIIDLAAYPQYIGPLRQEIERELGGTRTEKPTLAAVGRLRLLDAFCKESTRKNPPGIISWLRKTHEPIVISTGHVIPANSLIAASNLLFNPGATPQIDNPEMFRPERWLRPEEVDDNMSMDAEHKFGSATLDSLIFGYGKHACPGRPFGLTLVKMTMAYIVRHWDIRMGGGKVKRPDNIYMDFMAMPPFAPFGDLEIQFKSRRATTSEI